MTEIQREGLAPTLAALREKAASSNVENISEAATRAVFIDPLLRAMGFEGLEDIEWEYYVKASNEHIDYVLKVGQRPVVAVEAKSYGTDLADKHAAQLVQYAVVEGIEWGLLTNGRHMWVYNTGLPGDLRAKHVADVDLLADDQGEATDVLSLLGKEELRSQEKLKDWMRRAVLDRTLRLSVLDPGSMAVRQLASGAASATGFDVSAEEVSRWFARVLAPAPTPEPPSSRPKEPQADTEKSYWLLPAGPGDDGASPVEELRRWLGAGMWGMGRSTPNRKWMRAGDFVCFYATGVGVVASARLARSADELVTVEEWPEPTPMEGEVFKVPLEDVRWLPQPVAVDEHLRTQLEAFAGKRQSPIWSWFVQTTRKLSEKDFSLLAGAS